MKNASPSRIVLAASGIILCILLVLELAWYVFPALQFKAYQLVIIPLIAFLAIFITFYLAVEKFIYRKIKLIYKTIHALKSTKEIADEKMKMSSDVISEVNKEVIEWAKERSSEIDLLIKQADYRKEFLGNVSHELKTPIMSIQGYLETLSDGGIEDPTINSIYIEKALKNVERMTMIIDDLVNISMLESGELELNYKRFDINELVLEVYESLEMQAAQSNTTLSIKEGCDHAFYVYADEKLIREVLVNLITNAIKYGRANGFVHTGYYNMGDNILIEVADNGLGIGKEHLNRVFERFFRIEKSRSRDMGGTGLGLAIVKHIVEAHHQNVNVRSTAGEGSTFGFTLKRAK